MSRALVVFALLAAVWLAWRFVRDWPRGGVAAPPLVLGAEPEQEELDRELPVTVDRGGRTFFVIRTHRYSVTGRVVSATTYDYLWTNDFFDVDLGLVWGDHVPELLDRVTFSQNARWLYWRSDTPVSDAERADITRHAGNVHTIPAEGHPALTRALRSVRSGDLVKLDGYLVRIADAQATTLARSSTSRTDTGGGACEIVWVDRLQVGERAWE